MNRAFRCLIVSLIGAPALAMAMNVCTDAAGKTVYQQQPCPPLPLRRENAPLAAAALTPAVVEETVRRFRASLSNRDAATAAEFLAPTFTASIRTASGTERYDRAAFAGMLTQVLNAAAVYKSAALCAAPVMGDFSASVTCEVRESLTLLKKSSEGLSNDTHKVAVFDGVAKLVSITSVPASK